MIDRTYRFPTQICDGFVHFSGTTHVWTFTLGYFAQESEHVAVTRDNVLSVRADLETMLRHRAPPGELQRVESELMDYEPVPPYRVHIGDRDPEPFTDYRAANIYARTQSGANRLPVYIRDAAGVIIWEIRLTDEPLGQ